MDSLQTATTVLTGLVAGFASLTIIQAWRLRSILRGGGSWFYFTLAISLSMASVYCFLLLPATGLGQCCVVLCYPLMGASMLCYLRWLGILAQLIPRPWRETSPTGHATGMHLG